MKNKFIEHITSIILITIILLTLVFILESNRTREKDKNDSQIESYINSDLIDFDDPLNKIIFKETLNYFYPEKAAFNDSLIGAINQYRAEKLLQSIDKARHQKNLNRENLLRILSMYLKFIAIYLIVLIFSYYGVQTIGVYRFIKKQQNRSSYLYLLLLHLNAKPDKISTGYIKKALLYLSKAAIKGIVYFVLFSPAYVLAYSFKTEINTGSAFFMILLGIVSNGMLIIYSNKFYTFLTAESKKGYVQTAIVKNLNNKYDRSSAGISTKSIFSFRKKFPNHVFGQIFTNAKYQYLSSFKEQASFLISSLIIIEMALNIQGFLSYELLQEALYKNYSMVIIIILGIFYIVKFTDIAADWISYRETKRYENNAD
jgi:predicted nucleic-acid-binding protein